MSETHERLTAINERLLAVISDEEDPAVRLRGHLNSAEYWLDQADIYDFPSPIRAECLQLAGIHATLAQALMLKSEVKDR